MGAAPCVRDELGRPCRARDRRGDVGARREYDNSPPPKVFVCKYVGKPGVDERLRTGDNPVNPSASSIPGWDRENPGNLVGLEFADAQGRSVVIAIDVGQDEPDSSCPPPTPPPPTDVCPNIDGNQAEVPHGMVEDEQGNCVTPPPAPTDVCPNIDGNQAEVPDGMVKDEQGNCVRPRRPRPTCARTSTATRPPLRPEP